MPIAAENIAKSDLFLLCFIFLAAEDAFYNFSSTMQTLILLTGLIFGGLWNKCSPESFIISRTVDAGGKDRFKNELHSSSSCKKSVYLDCGAKNGRRFSNMTRCECACKSGYSTFGLYHQQWTCINDTKLRDLLGCQVNFGGEGTHSPLKVLTKSQDNKYNYKMLIPSPFCGIDYSKSRYRDCDGSWKKLVDGQKSFSLFPISESIPGKRFNIYKMQVLDDSLLSGRIVSLRFSCSKSFSPCLVFKMVGKLGCPISNNSLPTVQSTSTSVTTSSDKITSTNKVISSTSTVFRATGPKAKPTAIAGNIVIEGLATALGALCLIAGLVVMVILVRKKRKNQMKNCQSQHDLSAPHSDDFAMHPSSPGLRSDDGLVYDYAVQRQNIWVQHLIPNNSGYEIPIDNHKIQQEVPDNPGYLIPIDNFKTPHSVPDKSSHNTQVENEKLSPNEPMTGYEIPWTDANNDGYEKLQDFKGTCDDVPSAKDRESNTPLDNMRWTKTRNDKADNGKTQSFRDEYMPMSLTSTTPTDGTKRKDVTLYDSDEYVAMC